jgi:hypothetical protein
MIEYRAAKATAPASPITSVPTRKPPFAARITAASPSTASESTWLTNILTATAAAEPAASSPQIAITSTPSTATNTTAPSGDTDGDPNNATATKAEGTASLAAEHHQIKTTIETAVSTILRTPPERRPSSKASKASTSPIETICKRIWTRI